MILEATQKLSRKECLSAQDMALVMKEIMSGSSKTPDIAAFLSALNTKGETVEEISAAASVMREYAILVKAEAGVVLDTCGTGGDAKGTFNISTAVALVVAACGIKVAKHGNRAISSSSGSADILEALGVNIHLPPEKLSLCLKEIGIAFLFAQDLHPAMKFAMPARKQIKGKTIFNILGPLSNPARATHQLIGVYSPELTEKVALVLSRLGTKHALVVHGEDGLDEITTTTKTKIAELKEGRVHSFEIAPEDFGFKRAKAEDLKGKDAQYNSGILRNILKGEKTPLRDIVLLNSAAALYCAGAAESIKAGLPIAQETIDSGKALQKLDALIKFTN